MDRLEIPPTESSRELPARRHLRRNPCPPLARWLSLVALLAAQSLLAAAFLSSQAPPKSAAAPVPARKPVHARKAAATAPAPAQPAPAPAPVQPRLPDWPANNVPTEASIVFDSHGLLIVASNSSLVQVLKEVGVETGAKVEGLDADQRVFGTYGPGPVRDVVTQLLDGSGYNVLLIGDRGEGTPRRIVLTIRTGSGLHPTGNAAPKPPSDDDSDADQEADDQLNAPPQSAPTPPITGVPARVEQQFLQQRQQQMERLQGGQQPPQN